MNLQRFFPTALLTGASLNSSRIYKAIARGLRENAEPGLAACQLEGAVRKQVFTPEELLEKTRIKKSVRVEASDL